MNTVEAQEPQHDLPKMPVASVLWKPYLNIQTGCATRILASGAHHTCYIQNLTDEHLEDFADMAKIEFVLIDQNTQLLQFKNELRWSEAYYQLKQ